MPRDFHFYTSLVKSAIRIIAGIQLATGDIVLAGGLLIAAEVLGIIEEL
jgi:hypothetical protein